MGLKDAIKQKSVKSTETLVLEQKFDELFKQKRDDDEERTGMHGSGVIASDNEFCYRQQVLSFFFKGIEPKIPPGLRRIFLNGWYVHIKWQKLFEKAGIAVGIEQRGESKMFRLLFTPDAIVRINGRLYVVEIKSVNSNKYRTMNQHPSASKQLQLYMHMTCIPHGIVLNEDKNTQEFKLELHDYDPELARPYVERMLKVNEFIKRYEDTGKLPSKMCESCDCNRAKNCSYRDACFNINRIPLGSKEQTPE